MRSQGRWWAPYTWTWVGLGLLVFSVEVAGSLRAQTNQTPVESVPASGTFWSLQLTNYPPLPWNPLTDVSVYYLGYGNHYLYDDSQVDYEALQAEQEADRMLSRLEWETGLISEAEYWEKEGGPPSMLRSMAAGAFGSDNAVYLVNLTAVSTGAAPVTASFDIIGGTNNVPYDILRGTNAGAAVSQWSWIGIGYTSNRYSFSNQPLAAAFYTLAKPQQTLVVGLGDDAVAQCQVPPGLSNAVMLAAGGGQSVALRADGTVTAWGQNAYGQGSVPTNLTGVSMVAAGWWHSVALLTNGSVAAWGYNGAPIYNLTNVPADLTDAAVISAQAMHSLALRSNGTVVAWGYNQSGVTNIPAGLTNVTAIAAGYQHNLVVKADGTVVAWGDNQYGQTSVPAGLSNVWDVAAGVFHSVALRKDGTVVAWGRNTYGETNVPANLSNVVAIAAGGDPYNPAPTFYTLALKRDNTVAGWGIGLPLTPVAGLSNVIAIAAGADHAFALRSGPRTPVLAVLPSEQFQAPGGNITFSSRGAGLYGVGYQWKTNGVNLTGATNATLTLNNVQPAHATAYTVTASNEVGTLTSPAANLTMVTPPTILSQLPMPTNQLAVFHKTLTLSVTATGVAETNGFPLSYQWQCAGINLPGAISNSYTIYGETNVDGNYKVLVSNAAGSTNAQWSVTMTYAGSYTGPGTLAHHLATNAVARTAGYTPNTSSLMEVINWTYTDNYLTNLHLITNAIWATNFWLSGVKGLSATAIGLLNETGGQGLVTMVSPRHCIFASHVHTNEGFFEAAFLDTNNIVHWRTNMQAVHLGSDISLGILNAELPPSVGFLSVVPTNLSAYLPTNLVDVVQGIGMNQDLKLFSQPITFPQTSIDWLYTRVIPSGLETNWSIAIRPGDSSAPGRLLIGNQMVLITHNRTTDGGPNYSHFFAAINAQMHFLSTNNNVEPDYQLTPVSLTNWPTIH